MTRPMDRAPARELRRLTHTPTPPADMERCVRCGVTLPPEHRHLLERAYGALACACDRCARYYEGAGVAEGLYVTVPQRYQYLRDFRLSDEQWDDLLIPVNMAFIFVKSATQRPIAYYPSPAGATESLLTLERWEALASENPALASLAPDVEALLINRTREARDYYLAPIDACYQLVGIIRTRWRGLSGGDEVWKAVARFFADLRARSVEVGGASDA